MRLLIALVCGLAAPAADAAGQAWPPPAGVGAITLSSQAIYNTGHRLSDGSLLPDGKSRNVSLAVDADYAITDRLSVSLGLPYVFSRFTGPGPSLANLPVDACRCWQSAFQDVTATVRYSALAGPVALMPSLSVGVPSHDYRWEGEAVAGFGLRELRVALDAGARLDRLSTRLALVGRYQYAAVEDVLDVPNNRSNWSVGASYLATTRLALRGAVSWQRTHGGLRIGGDGIPGEADTPDRFREHDRLLRDNSWHLGGAATYSLPRVDLFVSYLEFMGGTDTHAGRAFTIGTSWPFRR
ncbi:MAG: hypothetical protein AB7U83_03405 [Vicinamibacterales bacterium]